LIVKLQTTGPTAEASLHRLHRFYFTYFTEKLWYFVA